MFTRNLFFTKSLSLSFKLKLRLRFSQNLINSNFKSFTSTTINFNNKINRHMSDYIELRSDTKTNARKGLAVKKKDDEPRRDTKHK